MLYRNSRGCCWGKDGEAEVISCSSSSSSFSLSSPSSSSLFSFSSTFCWWCFYREFCLHSRAYSCCSSSPAPSTYLHGVLLLIVQLFPPPPPLATLGPDWSPQHDIRFPPPVFSLPSPSLCPCPPLPPPPHPYPPTAPLLMLPLSMFNTFVTIIRCVILSSCSLRGRFGC